MSGWLKQVIARIRLLAGHGKVTFTYKAFREVSELDLELDETDVCMILTEIGIKKFQGRVRSTATREWLYVFAPEVGGVSIYLKVLLRSDCIVISFHEDQKYETE